jgi:hypothetical protein
VSIHWRASPDALSHALRQHGAEPDAVTDVGTAWRSFGEFLQIAIDGIDMGPDSDADGFIVQWGRYTWNERRPSLSFTRQLAVTEGVDKTDPNWQPELWQVDLSMVFDVNSDLTGLDSLEIQDTGFSFAPIGSARAAALARTWFQIQQYAPLRMAWSLTPAETKLSFECVC